jgi:hypothetical protein
MSQPTTLRALPEVAVIMRHLTENFPELQRGLKAQPGRSRILHDVIAAGIGSAVGRSQPSLEQSVATVMAAGYHVTSQPVNVTPMRKRTPGTQVAPTAENALTSVTADSQRGRLLLAYLEVSDLGLTDDQAARMAGIGEKSCWWKRCGELRRAGLIEPMVAGDDDTPVMREGESGMLRTVSVITPEGRAVAYGFE